MSLDLTQEQSKWFGWLDTIETEGVNLTKWEEDFCQAVRDQFDAGRFRLSERQVETLERIYSEKTP